MPQLTITSLQRSKVQEAWAAFAKDMSDLCIKRINMARQADDILKRREAGEKATLPLIAEALLMVSTMDEVDDQSNMKIQAFRKELQAICDPIKLIIDGGFDIKAEDRNSIRMYCNVQYADSRTGMVQLEAKYIGDKSPDFAQASLEADIQASPEKSRLN